MKININIFILDCNLLEVSKLLAILLFSLNLLNLMNKK